MGTPYGIRVASYPDPDRETEAWAEHLVEHDGGGLERAAVAHEQELLAVGWRAKRRSADEVTWEPPAAKRQRRSVEQAGAAVRRLVQALDRRKPPSHTVGPIVALAVGYLEALGDLLFYATTDEAWANGRAALRAMGGGEREKVDPLRPLFRGAAEVLSRASQPGTSRPLGIGAQSYAIAESRGRTRAGWSEVACSGSHVSSGAVKGLHAVELSVDAQRAVAGAELDPVDLAGLNDWLRDGMKPPERVRLYRRRLALQRGAGVCGIISDKGAHEATAELSDRAIVRRLTQMRARLERRLGRLPDRAEDLALATGDTSFLAPVAAQRREPEREHRRRPPAQPVAPMRPPAPRWM